MSARRPGTHEDTTVAQAPERVDRTVARLVAGGGVVLVVGQALPGCLGPERYATWWNVLGALLVTAVLVVAAASHRLGARTLAALCAGVPALSALLLLTSFVAFEGPDADAALPWVWALEPVAVSLLVLRAPVTWAVVASLGSALLPAVSALAVLGRVPDEVLAMTPVHLANVAFVVIIAGIRERLRAFARSEDAARCEAQVRARAEAEARRLEELGLLVHDEVLTVLAVAAGTGSEQDRPVSDALRLEARHALELLVGEPSSGAEATTSDEGLASMAAALRRIDPTISLDLVVTDPVPPPQEVLAVLTGATAEAVRNSVRHAGPGAARHVEVRLGAAAVSVVVRDDGCGFTGTEGREGRLGVRRGILGRVRALPGGHAELSSAPGAGTIVRLGWTA